jgi:excisionase family DNA binding protein
VEPNVTMPCEIMTADQVAQLLQVSRDMVYQLATRGELPARKVGRIWRFSREAIDEFMRGTGARNPGRGAFEDSTQSSG